MALDTYRRKRNFRVTPEPKGRKPKVKKRGLAFVIQTHAASHLHYDFRLELDGVLLSWAVPKGPSLVPSDKRLAMHVEDHPIEYGDFEGIIPAKQYGAGTVLLWDRGTWLPKEDPVAGYRKGKLKFDLQGEKLHGGWTLVRSHGWKYGGDKAWLLIKEDDDAARRVPGPVGEGPDGGVTEDRLEHPLPDRRGAAGDRDLPAGQAAGLREDAHHHRRPDAVDAPREHPGLGPLVRPLGAHQVEHRPLPVAHLGGGGLGEVGRHPLQLPVRPRQQRPARRAATRQVVTVRSAARSASARSSRSTLLSSAPCSPSAGRRPTGDAATTRSRSRPTCPAAPHPLPRADELLPAGQHLAAQQRAAPDALVDAVVGAPA